MRPSTVTQNGSPGPTSDVGSGGNPAYPGQRVPRIFSGRGLAFVVLALSLAVTFSAFELARQEAAQQLDQRFGSAVKDIADDVREHMAHIEEGLQASRAFVLAAKKISREEWRTFQKNQEIETYHAGTFGIGLAAEVRREDANAYVRPMRRQDQSDYKIWPAGDRAIYVPIRFTASHNGDTRALGLDMYSEPRRKLAMERARDTGKPALSGVVTLVKAGEKEAHESIILFLPVYKHALPTDAAVNARRAAFVGAVYCPILIEKFWGDVVAKASQLHVAVQITDANGSAIFPSLRGTPASDKALMLRSGKDVYGQPWEFEFWALPGFADTGLSSRAASVAAAGIAISFLLFGMLWVLASTNLRAEAIARNMTRALRDGEGRLRNVVEQSPDAMIMHQDGKIVFVNKAMVRLMRVADAAALIGQSGLSVVHPERRKIAERRMQDLYMKKMLPLSEQVYIRADGTAVDVEVAGVPFELDAQPAALETAKDISERKRHEAENERLRRLYAALSQINQAIIWMRTRDELFQKVCDVLVEHGRFRMAWIGWNEPASHRLVPVAQSGDDGGYLQGVTIYTDDRPEGQGLAGRAFRDAKPYICNDFLGDPATLPFRAKAEIRGFRAAAVFPVRLKGEVRGTLAVYATETGFFQDMEISLLVEAAINVSFALDNFAREEERRSTETTVKRLAAIVESTDDAIIAKDLRGIITDWNPSAEKMFGYTVAEALGKSVGMIIPLDRQAEELEIMARVVKGELSQHFETVRMRKDGQTFPVSVTISPIWGSDGAVDGAMKIIGVSKIARDISERKRAEEVLYRFHMAVQTSQDGIFLMDFDTFRYLDVNETGCRMLGYSRGELLGMRTMDTNVEMTEAEQRWRFDAARALGPGHTTTETEGLTFHHKDGSVFPIEVARRYLRIDGKEIVVGFARDVTARKRAEREQRELARQVNLEHTRLIEAQAVAKIGSWEAELTELNVTWSEETYRIFETDPAHFQPTYPGFLALIHPGDRARVEEAFTAALGEISTCAIEHRIVMPDGRVKIVEERWKIVRDHQGQPLRASGTCQDITQRKEAEQALQEYARRLQAVSRKLLEVQENERRQLARELHDTVGQELTALSLNLSMVRSAIPPDLAAAVGNRLDDSQKLLEDTMHHLRNIMVELRPPGIDEFGLVAALTAHARRAADRSGFEVVLSGVEPQPRFPMATAIALFRIVQEALNNTVKHAQASKITIELREGPDLIVLTIADNGKGFDAMRKPLIGVYGMGMTTMRERAEAIGAHLRIDSEIGKGTRITIENARTSLPAAQKRPGT